MIQDQDPIGENTEQREQFTQLQKIGKRTSSGGSYEEFNNQTIRKQIDKAESFQNDSSTSTQNNSTDQIDDDETNQVQSQHIILSEEQLIELPLENHRVLLVRHGTSIFNEESEKYEKISGIKFKDARARDFNINRELIDTPLTQQGRDQANKYQQNASQFQNIHTVFISPMKRTLETCYYMFKDHPSRDQIKFIVFPYICEIISKICDISEFDEDSLIQKYPWFDFSYLRSVQEGRSSTESWQLSMFQDEKVRSEIESLLDMKTGQPNKDKKEFHLRDVLVEKLEQVFPKPIESYESVFDRAKIAKKYIKQYVKENQIDTTKSTLMIISHNAFIRNFTSLVPDNGKFSAESPVKGKTLQNCQVLEHFI